MRKRKIYKKGARRKGDGYEKEEGAGRKRGDQKKGGD